MTTDAADIQSLETEYLLQVYRRIPIVFNRGEGSHLYDTEGRPYLDFISGLGVASMGHANPVLAEALADQAKTLLHTSNLYFHPLQGQVGERLARLSGLARVFFCNSGTEAVEGCLKFARRYWYSQDVHSRTRFVALERSFHGRTLGALSTTAEPRYRAPFAPLLDVTFVSPDDPSALEAALTDEVAALIVEPIQGEGGVWPLSDELAEVITVGCRRNGTLLIADEIQCGLGRTGAAFYSATLGLEPDLMSLGKALGGGVPIGALLMSQAVADAVAPGDHGTTYGGNLLSCRAALVFLDMLEQGGLEHVRQAGERLSQGLEAIAARHDVVQEVRGAGLMRGVAMTEKAAIAVVAGAQERRLLVNRTGGNVVRMLPPLTVTDDEIDRALDILEQALANHSG